MGLEQPYRGEGLGSKLLEAAIKEAKALPEAEYLDLRVISLNTPAIKLYEKFGFQVVTTIRNFARIKDQPVDDIMMSISVG